MNDKQKDTFYYQLKKLTETIESFSIDKNTQLREMLIKCKKEFYTLYRSLGYDSTHMSEIEKVLTRTAQDHAVIFVDPFEIRQVLNGNDLRARICSEPDKFANLPIHVPVSDLQNVKKINAMLIITRLICNNDLPDEFLQLVKSTIEDKLKH